MTSLGKRCHTTHLDASELTVGFLSVASSNIAAITDFSDTDLTTARLSTGAINLGDYEVSAPSGGTFEIKEGGGSVRFALSSGGAFLQGYQPQLTVGGASIPDVVLSSFGLNLDDDPSLTNSLVTAGALSHYIENDLQPVLLTAPAGSQGGVRASAISLTTPSSLNVPSCRAVLELLNNQENALYRGILATVRQIGYINTDKIPALQDSVSVNSVLMGELALSVASNYTGLVDVANQIGYINGTEIPALQESVAELDTTLSLNVLSVGNLALSLSAVRTVADHNTAKANVLGALYTELETELSLNVLSVGNLALSLSAVRAVADHNNAKANVLGALYTELETELSVQQTTLSTQRILVDSNAIEAAEAKLVAISVSADVTELALSVGVVRTAVDLNTTKANVLGTLYTTLETELTTQRADVDSNNTTAVEARAMAISVSADVAELALSVGVVRTAVDLNTTKTDTLGTLYTTLETDVSTLDVALSLHATAVSVNSEDISTLDTALSVNIAKQDRDVSGLYNRLALVTDVAERFITATDFTIYYSSAPFSINVDNNEIAAFEVSQVTFPFGIVRSDADFQFSAGDSTLILDSTSPSLYLTSKTSTNKIKTASELETEFLKSTVAANVYAPLTTTASLQSSVTTLQTDLAGVDQKTLSVASVSNELSNRIGAVSSKQNAIQQTLDQTVVDVNELETVVSKNGNATRITGVAAVNFSIASNLIAQFNESETILRSAKIYKDDVAVDNELLPSGSITSLISVAMDSHDTSVLSVGAVASANTISMLSLGAELTSAQQAVSVNTTDLSTSAEIVSELYLSVGDLAVDVASLEGGLDVAKNDINTLEGVTSATLDLIISVGAELDATKTDIETIETDVGTLDLKLSVQHTQISLNTISAVEAQALAISVAALDFVTREAAENDFLGVDSISSKFAVTGEGDPTVYTLETDAGTAIHVYSTFSHWANDAFYGSADAVLKSNTSFATTKWTLEKDLATQASNDTRYGTLPVQQLLDQRVTTLEEGGPFGTLSVQQLLDERVTVLEEGSSGVDSTLIMTSGNATQVKGVSTVNMITTQNSSTCARFKTDRIELLQDLHIDHITPGQPSKLISTDDVIFVTPGGIYKDSVATENEFIKKSDIDALIAQRLNAAFMVSNQTGLPLSTECTVTRESAGVYLVQFVDSWNTQFLDHHYSILLQDRSVELGSGIPKPSRRAQYWTNKSNTQFRIICTEEEDGFPTDGTGAEDTPRDPGRLDFVCIRGAVVFAQGSFNAFSSSS